jgi:hypothetical protein
MMKSLGEYPLKSTVRINTYGIYGREFQYLPIGIGGSLATPPLPHHRTYGSVYGGSTDYADREAATEARPIEPKKRFGKAMVSAGLFASRQGPCGLPAV